MGNRVDVPDWYKGPIWAMAGPLAFEVVAYLCIDMEQRGGFQRGEAAPAAQKPAAQGVIEVAPKEATWRSTAP